VLVFLSIPPNLVDHLYFFGHVVLVEEPLAVTNILGSGTEKILVTAGNTT
jgi:hypothetical protein